MEILDFDYALPKGLVAQSPAIKRDSSRLMVLFEKIKHDFFGNLAEYLEKDDVLVLNDSRVLNAKLTGHKKTGGKVEFLIIKSRGEEADCLIRGKKIGVGIKIKIGNVTCQVTNKSKNGFAVRFNHSTQYVIEKYGETPLPYYIKESLQSPERYQTVFSRNEGSIAAPTAGLHFTNSLLRNIKKKGVKIAYQTLHIGPSTFLPIRAGNNNNIIQPEYYSIDKKNSSIINKGIKKGSLIPVGTTSIKALESAIKDSKIRSGEGWSDLFISPGYNFKLPIKGMITNFHLPKSSLLLLVCALFGKDRILNAYKHATTHGYRFYSFGDAMFIRGENV
jgi:S-adenosylmethionine:tRNA ribosyltransferase-isomerase